MSIKKKPEQIILQQISPYIKDRYSPQGVADITVEAIQKDYYIQPKGTPIKPEDVRKGDRLRYEWSDGDITEYTAPEDGEQQEDYAYNLYLLDRPEPDPDADFVFPDRDGAIIQLRSPKHHYPISACLSYGRWYVAGEDDVFATDDLIGLYSNFKVLNGGADE